MAKIIIFSDSFIWILLSVRISSDSYNQKHENTSETEKGQRVDFVNTNLRKCNNEVLLYRVILSLEAPNYYL